MEKVSSKYTRSLDLIAWGLNSPRYSVVKPPDVFQQLIDLNYPVYSLREIKEIAGKHLANITLRDLFVNHPTIVSQSSWVVSQGIDWKQSFIAGVIMILNDEWRIEALTGPAMVSELTRAKKSPDIKVSGNFDDHPYIKGGYDHWIQTVLYDLTVKIPHSYFSVEFSVYNYRVGAMNKNIVYWDYELLTNNGGANGFSQRQAK